ncbi:MAG TPA: AarF/UbiB family protein [Streptosporangiaceae bacterium]|nr:AarF/UbiB family protein [Streptosporangiaceae bacterium]
MDQLSATFARHHRRLEEIVNVLGRYGFAAWAASRVTAIPGVKIAQRLADPDLVALSPGERLRGAATDLGTTFVKFGQMLSLRPDLVGPDVAAELEQLQTSVAPDPPEVVRGIVVTELGAPMDELFATFDADAMGSGSVAQVHRATMHDGTDIVVKVLHAGVEQKVAEDLELMRALAASLEEQDPEIALYRPTIMVSEFDKMMRGAIDMGQELANLERFTTNFGAEPDVVIPAPYRRFSRTRVLTMSRLAGQGVSDRGALEAAGWDVDRFVHRAAEIYLEMIFRDGVFHADPHPGNFLLLSGNRLGILDFGDVGYVTGPRRAQLESLVIAVVTRDVEDVTDTILEMTTPPPDVDVLRLRADIDVWLHRYFLGDVAHLDIAGILGSGMHLMHDHHLVLPADLALLFRVLLRLQGLGRSLGTDVRLTELLMPYINEILADRFDPKRMARHAVRTARSWQHLVESLPDQLLATLERARTGELGMDFRVRDVDGAVDHLVDGLLASASLLAAAQLISRKAGPTFRGVSIAGVAAGVSAIATWRRLAVKRQDHKSFVQRARAIWPSTPEGPPSRQVAGESP